MNTTFKQKAKVGVAGSFFNQMMSNNSTLPEVGKGATQMHYSDRTCFEVIEVSEDFKTVRLEYLDAKWDNTKSGGQGHQNWILEPTGRYLTVVWRNNTWKTKGRKITFTKEFKESIPSEYIGMWLRKNNPDLADKIYKGDVWPQEVIDGITKETFEYNKINILFGTKDYYYDWSF